MSDWGYLLLVLVLSGLVTFLERALPFLAGGWLLRMPWVRTLGTFLAPAIMVLLTLATAVGAAKGHSGLPVPETAAIILTMALQTVLRRPILAIFGGTLLYIAFRTGFIPGFV